jgi:hypothetical protein
VDAEHGWIIDVVVGGPRSRSPSNEISFPSSRREHLLLLPLLLLLLLRQG